MLQRTLIISSNSAAALVLAACCMTHLAAADNLAQSLFGTSQLFPTPAQINASWPTLSGGPANWPRWVVVPLKATDKTTTVGYLPFMEVRDAKGTKQWYIPFTGLMVGGKDVASGAMTKGVQPSVLAMPYSAGNNANATSSARSHGALGVPADAEAVAVAVASRDFVGRTNAQADAVADGDLVPVVVSRATADSDNSNAFGIAASKATATSNAGVAGAVLAQATSITQSYGSGRATSDAEATATGDIVPLGVAADSVAFTKKNGGTTKAKAVADAKNHVGPASSTSVAMAVMGPRSSSPLPIPRRSLLDARAPAAAAHPAAAA